MTRKLILRATLVGLVSGMALGVFDEWHSGILTDPGPLPIPKLPHVLIVMGIYGIIGSMVGLIGGSVYCGIRELFR